MKSRNVTHQGFCLLMKLGLGKTIEAGMILHYQLHTGRAERILIVVPDTLIHQWLLK